MTFFRDVDEVSSYIGRMFEIFVQRPEHEAKLKNSGLVVRLNYTEPDCIFVVDFANQQVYQNDKTNSAPEANVDMYMKCDDAHRFWLGNLSFPIALARRKVRMEGSTAKAMKLLPLTNPLFATYRKLLEDANRSDLISAK
jgi:putative sterol carrier protein